LVACRGGRKKKGDREKSGGSALEEFPVSKLHEG
jgi:hypothetical protein